MPESATSWRRHLETVVLPWWEQAVRPHGGVFTCYSNDGTRISDDLYTWSQGRWAWLAAELAEEARAGRLSVDAELWQQRAVDSAALIADHALLGDGTVAFRLSSDGTPLPSGPDGELATSVFADLFAALGLAGGLRALPVDDSRRSHWTGAATQLLLTAELSSVERTALSEPYPVPEGYADLAAPMSLVHTASELLRAVPDSAPARAVRDRAWTRLHGENGFLREDWWWEFRPDDQTEQTLLSRHRTPGHLLELTWMLVHSAEEASARGDIGAEQLPGTRGLARLARRAVAIGEDNEQGGLFRYVDASGRRPEGPHAEALSRYEQLVTDTWDTKLWWVHAEAMYATALLAQRTGDAHLAAVAQLISDYTLSTFPDPDGAEWLQIRNRAGVPLDQVVALPVKDPFHIARSLLLLNRLTATLSQEI